jgi:hypothetical protein
VATLEVAFLVVGVLTALTTLVALRMRYESVLDERAETRNIWREGILDLADDRDRVDGHA